MTPRPIPFRDTSLVLVLAALLGCGGGEAAGSGPADPDGARRSFAVGQAALTELKVSSDPKALDRAIEAFDRAVELDPGEAELLYWSGRAWARRDIGRAIERFEAARRADDSNPDLLRRLGALRLERGELGEARDALSRGLELARDDPELPYQWGLLLEQEGNSDGALDAHTKAVELRPTLAKAHFRIGTLLHRAGRPDEAEAALAEYRRWTQVEQALQSALRELGDAREDADAHVAVGELYFQLMSWQQCAVSMERALVIAPDHSRAHCFRGMVHHLYDENDDAREHLDEAVAAAPRDPRPLRERAWFRLALGDRDGAVGDMWAARELDPDSVASHEGEALLALELSELQRAVDAFEAALGIDPEHVPSHLGRAQALVGLERYPEAAVHYRRVLDLEPAHAGARQSLDYLKREGKL